MRWFRQCRWKGVDGLGLFNWRFNRRVRDCFKVGDVELWDLHVRSTVLFIAGHLLHGDNHWPCVT